MAGGTVRVAGCLFEQCHLIVLHDFTEVSKYSEMQITSQISSHSSYSDCVSLYCRLLCTPLYVT
jgi:hypothetical protein